MLIKLRQAKCGQKDRESDAETKAKFQIEKQIEEEKKQPRGEEQRARDRKRLGEAALTQSKDAKRQNAK